MRHKMFLAVLAAVVLVMLPAAAQAQSAKAAVLVGDPSVAPASCDAGAWATLFQVNLKNSGSQKDFLLGLSGVTQIITNTRVKSSGGTSDTSEAEALIKVRILVDDTTVAKPGPIVFDRRKQTLIAVFNGICIDLNGDGIVNFNECSTPEELELKLDTQAAHHFNFVTTEVGTGVHTIKAQACADVNTAVQGGTASGSALFGKGALTVEEVRLVKGAVVEQ